MSSKGYKHTEEARRRISEASKGRKHTEETKRKLSEARKGIKYSDETKRKMSEAKKGKKLTEEHKRKISEAEKGRKLTEEAKRKLSEAHRGKKLTEEQKRKISETLIGKFKQEKLSPWHKGKKGVYSKETLEKMSRAKKGKPQPWIQGEKNPNWQGGKSFEPYSTDWTVTLRRSIRERDKYTCQMCGKLQGDRAFIVHHIDENKENCNPDNLVTVCPKCHGKLHRKQGG